MAMACVGRQGRGLIIASTAGSNRTSPTGPNPESSAETSPQACNIGNSVFINKERTYSEVHQGYRKKLLAERVCLTGNAGVALVRPTPDSAIVPKRRDGITLRHS